MSLEANKRIVRRVFEELFNNGNLVVVDELIAPDYVNHNGLHDIRGRDAIRRAIVGQFKAFPGLHTTIEDIIAEDDKVVIRAVDHFTSQPDKQPVAFPWIEILRLENGKLVEAWSEPQVDAAIMATQQSLHSEETARR